jgi:hypothetical protein
VSLIWVNSSAIAAIGYQDGILAVVFHNTGAYYHPGVPYQLFEAFLHAASKGRFYNTFIRGRYR